MRFLRNNDAKRTVPLTMSSSVDIAFAAFTSSRLAKITHITLTYRLQGYKTEIASKSSPLG